MDALGKLPELIDIIIASGAKLFVSAVGVPPVWAVDKLHAAGIPVSAPHDHPVTLAQAALYFRACVCRLRTPRGRARWACIVSCVSACMCGIPRVLLIGAWRWGRQQ